MISRGYGVIRNKIKYVKGITLQKIQPDPLFGINMTPSSNGAENEFEIAKISDNLGVDLISVQDHPYNRSSFNTWGP